MEVTEAMEEKVQKYAQKLPRFDDGLMSLRVTLAADKGDQSAEVIAKDKHAQFVAKSDGHCVYECIDAAFKKLETQITRHNDKVKHHRVHEGTESQPAPEPEAAE